MRTSGTDNHLERIAHALPRWAAELGFSHCGVAGVELPEAEARLRQWLERGWHGEMEYMARHGTLRSRPGELEPGTVRVISVRMDYLPEAADPWAVLNDPRLGYISRYALGRDYHKLMRKRLQQLAERIVEVAGPFRYRPFVDSAPVMEKPLALNAGLGWMGKHTNLLARDGSWFFLGELYIDLPLPATNSEGHDHCGRCRACIDICPTRAIVAPQELDARRCISYLTIELQGAIPVELRPLMGNRIYGCDDCQLVCPWNRFARTTSEPDFAPRHGLDAAALTELFAWDEPTFLERTAGSPIRRLGHVRWLRNIAVALGNAPTDADVVAALHSRRDHPDPLIQEHVAWALARHQAPPPA